MLCEIVTTGAVIMFHLKLRRGQHEDRILAWYCGFNANISFTSQAVKNLSAHPTFLFWAVL